MDLVIVMTRGGQGRVVMDTCVAAGHRPIGILDDTPAGPAEYHGVPVIGRPDEWRKVAPGTGFVLAIGQRQRIELGRALQAAGYPLPSVVHPMSFVSPSVKLADGAIVLSGCTINADASIGEFVIVNASCSVDHDNVLETASQLGPGVVFPGNVRVCEGAFVGAGAVSLPGKTIGAWSVVGAGALVTKDVAPGVTVAGSPARELPRR